MPKTPPLHATSLFPVTWVRNPADMAPINSFRRTCSILGRSVWSGLSSSESHMAGKPAAELRGGSLKDVLLLSIRMVTMWHTRLGRVARPQELVSDTWCLAQIAARSLSECISRQKMTLWTDKGDTESILRVARLPLVGDAPELFKWYSFLDHFILMEVCIGWFAACLRISTAFTEDFSRETYLWDHFGQTEKITLTTCPRN